MSWLYNISLHTLSKDGIVLDDQCYSGAFPAGFNDPGKIGIEDVGPIPPGHYTISGPPFTDPKHGPYCLRLTPDAPTRAFILKLGRQPDSFLLHGKPLPPRDVRSGSDGCICSSPKDKRGAVYMSGDRDLLVISE